MIGRHISVGQDMYQQHQFCNFFSFFFHKGVQYLSLNLWNSIWGNPIIQAYECLCYSTKKQSCLLRVSKESHSMLQHEKAVFAHKTSFDSKYSLKFDDSCTQFSRRKSATGKTFRTLQAVMADVQRITQWISAKLCANTHTAYYCQRKGLPLCNQRHNMCTEKRISLWVSQCVVDWTCRGLVFTENLCMCISGLLFTSSYFWFTTRIENNSPKY